MYFNYLAHIFNELKLIVNNTLEIILIKIHHLHMSIIYIADMISVWNKIIKSKTTVNLTIEVIDI